MRDNFPTALTFEGAAFRARRQEAEILLRMGAILNAVHAASRNVMRVPSSAEDRCDQLHAWIEVGSHLTKCHVVLMKRFDGLAWDLAERGQSKGEPFTAEMSLAKLRTLFNRDSWFMKACFNLRDTVAFHADAQPLLEWLDRQPPDQAICLFSQGGPFVKDIISDAPLAMVDHEARRVIDTEHFMDTLGHVVAALPRLLEAMCHGFGAKFGLAVALGVKEGHHVVHFYDAPTTQGAASPR